MLLQMCICILNIFAVNQSLFDDLTCLCCWWCRHSPVGPCFKWLHGLMVSCPVTHHEILSKFGPTNGTW